jgi:hypothetical protein
LIAAFDIATATGVCDGAPGSAPRVFTWYLDDGGQSRAHKLCYFRRLLDKYFAEEQGITAVYYEAPVNIGVMMKIGATDKVIALLRGAVGVFESCAINAGIPVVEAVSIQDARQALTGKRTFKKGTAKNAIMQTAKMMGVKVETDHEADAYAVWWYACARQNPRIAHLSQPLFAR